MSFSRACTEVWTPRRISLSVSRPNQRSTWFIQDEPVGVKWTWKRGCRASQVLICGGVVGGVVVADQVHVQAGGHRLVDRGQELPELDGPVAAVQLADDGAVGDVEGREQAGDAVPQVVVGAAFGHARHHRQHRLGPVQRLDLALFIHAQHHRLLRRVVVQADDIDDLLHEERVGGQLEGVLQVRLEVKLLPDPPDGGLRTARYGWPWTTATNACPCPGRPPAWPRPRPRPGPAGSTAAGPAAALVQAIQSPGDEPGPPAVHGGLIHPQIAAACLFVPPSAQPSTIFARIARYWAVFARRAHRISWARSASSRPARLRPADRRSVLQPGQPLPRELRRHLDTDLTATPNACAAQRSASPRHTPG